MKKIRELSRAIKARKTRRENEIKKRISNTRIGDKNARNVIDLLSKDLTTKKGIERSKRLEKLIFEEKNVNALKKFKEFESLNKIEKPTMRDAIKAVGRSDYDFYYENRELIKEYNSKYKELKKKYGKGFANKKHSNYSRDAKIELLKQKETIDLQKQQYNYNNKKLKDRFKGN